MKRTEKSKANSRQKSRANGRQSNQRTATETRRSTRISTIQSKAAANQPASPEASKNRCRCPAGTGRSDRLLRSSNAESPENREGFSRRLSAQQHEDCITKYYEIHMDKEPRSAYLRTENEKQNVFDSESRSDSSFTVQKDTEVIHSEVKGRTKINCYMQENQSEFSET